MLSDDIDARRGIRGLAASDGPFQLWSACCHDADVNEGRRSTLACATTMRCRSVGHTMYVVTPRFAQIDVPFLPFVFDISVGVRRSNDTLRAEVEKVLRLRRAAVDSILADFHVVRVDRPRLQRAAAGQD
jgi:hypothetical protein